MKALVEERMHQRTSTLYVVGLYGWIHILKTGKVTTVIHLSDSIDLQQIYPISKCCAKHQGEGILEGNNVGIGLGAAEKGTEVKCQDGSSHRSLAEAVFEFAL